MVRVCRHKVGKVAECKTVVRMSFTVTDYDSILADNYFYELCAFLFYPKFIDRLWSVSYRQ